MIRSTRVLLPSLILASLVIIMLTAWASDDAFITLCTVDNWRQGYGMTWNVNERVQTYTHPLWMFLLAGLYLINPNGYLTAIVLSLLISFAVIIIFLHRYRDDPFTLILGWAILTVSKAFVDYSTSGLENPLTHLLVLLFAIEFLRTEFPINKQNFCLLAFLAGLGVLNRMDTLLLFAPALIYIFIFQHLNWRGYHNSRVSALHTLGIIFPILLWLPVSKYRLCQTQCGHFQYRSSPSRFTLLYKLVHSGSNNAFDNWKRYWFVCCLS